MKNIIALVFAVIVWLIIPLICAYGWAMNVVKLIETTGEHGVLFIARCIGVLAAPLGVVLGFVN